MGLARIHLRTAAVRRVVMLAVLPLGGGGCKVGPDYERPVTTMPADWSADAAADAAPSTSLDMAAETDLRCWWRGLDDPTLTALVERAVESNLEVRLADARLQEAIALRQGVFADLFPAIGLDSDYVHARAARNASTGDGNGGLSATISQSASKVSGLALPSATIRYGDNSLSIRLPEPGAGGVPDLTASRSTTLGGDGGGFRRDRNSYQTLVGATWEIDIWGGIRRAVEAADAEIEASRADRRAVLVSVAAEVARNYVLLRGLQRRVEVTRDNIAIQQETLESIQARFAASLATGTDVLQAQTQLQRTRASLPPLKAGIRETIYRLGVLLGEAPESLLDLLEPAQPFPGHPDVLTVGLPSGLLRRRPDIRAAERRLAAETALIGVEVTELFPRVSLTGDFGLQTAEFHDYPEGDSLTWSFGPLVRWRLFEFGRLVSAIQAQEERQKQALLLYYQTVLNALEQVESALANYAAQDRRSVELSLVNDVNRRAFEMAKGEYAVGMISFLSVLDTQRSLFSTQTELIESQQQTLIELINVYEALGGGWPAAEDVPLSDAS